MRSETVTKTSAGTTLLKREPEGDACEVRCVHPQSVSRGWEQLLPDEESTRLADVFQTLADASRLKIVYSLLHQELCTCDLAAIVGRSESAVSQHLGVLRRQRLIRSRREGKMIYHMLDDDHISMLLAVCLEHVRGDAKK